MSLTAWNPLSELEVMRRQVDRVFNQVLPPVVTLPRWELTRPLQPSVDVYTSGQDLVVVIELPGFRPDDVTLETSEDAIHLAGEVKREDDVRGGDFYRRERPFGRFERVIPLPYRIEVQQARAAMRDGLLTIRAPLAEALKAPRSRKLAVETT